jgi:hypothetical protein
VKGLGFCAMACRLALYGPVEKDLTERHSLLDGA